MNWVFWAVIILIALFVWLNLGMIFPKIGDAIEKGKNNIIGIEEEDKDGNQKNKE